MKTLIALVTIAFASLTFAADAQPAKHPEPKAKPEANCVTKDKKGNCPAAPKSEKPTPKKKAEKPAEPVKK
jgi:hypothetical protein